MSGGLRSATEAAPKPGISFTSGLRRTRATPATRRSVTLGTILMFFFEFGGREERAKEGRKSFFFLSQRHSSRKTEKSALEEEKKQKQKQNKNNPPPSSPQPLSHLVKSPPAGRSIAIAMFASPAHLNATSSRTWSSPSSSTQRFSILKGASPKVSVLK